MEELKVDNQKIKIWFSDMWPNFDFHDNYFTIYLSQYFSIELNPNPDFLIHSIFSKNYLRYNCFKICLTGEDTRPNFSESDYHIGFDFNDNPNYLRWPLFLMNKYEPEYLLKQKDVETIIQRKSRFCSFVVSNSSAKERIDFFKKLSLYKKVDSGGRYMNNIGQPVVNKLNFLNESKFNIAFENASSPGYTTEKIFEAFLSNCVPIYWGNPRIEEDFNEKAFINIHKYKSVDEAIDFIKYVDTNDEVYKSILKEACFSDNKIPEQFQFKEFINFFTCIFEQSLQKKKVYKLSHKGMYWWYRIKGDIKNSKSKAAVLKTFVLGKNFYKK